jgi:hypothetical protein
MIMKQRIARWLAGILLALAFIGGLLGGATQTTPVYAGDPTPTPAPANGGNPGGSGGGGGI